MEILDILKSLFSSIWSIFTGVMVPGLGISFGVFFLAAAAIKLSILILHAAVGIGGGTSYRSGSSRNPKISENRRGDEY